MVTIGIDPHKQTHSGVAVDPLGVQIAQRTVAARRAGFGQLLEWARTLDSERVWVIEDVRHVSGSLERFLIDRGETVVRLPPRLMANARQGVRERGGPVTLARRVRGRASPLYGSRPSLTQQHQLPTTTLASQALPCPPKRGNSNTSVVVLERGIKRRPDRGGLPRRVAPVTQGPSEAAGRTHARAAYAVFCCYCENASLRNSKLRSRDDRIASLARSPSPFWHA
jgi:hypothetical protein